MNELQALMGVQVLRYLDQLIAKRGEIDRVHRECLRDVPGIHLPLLPTCATTTPTSPSRSMRRVRHEPRCPQRGTERYNIFSGVTSPRCVTSPARSLAVEDRYALRVGSPTESDAAVMMRSR